MDKTNDVSSGDPILDAINNLVAVLAKVFGPKSITQAPQREAQQEAEAQGLGDQLGPQR
jgi:hypothetical protein